MLKSKKKIILVLVISTTLTSGCTLLNNAEENRPFDNFVDTVLDDENEIDKFKEGNSKLQQGIEEHEEEGEQMKEYLAGNDDRPGFFSKLWTSIVDFIFK